MKRTSALFIATFAALCICDAPTITAQVIDKTVAVVGNEIITQSELELKLLQLSMRSPEEYRKDPTIRDRMLDAMVTDKLILAQADLDSVTVSDDEVNAQVDAQMRQMEQNYGSREKLEQAAGMSVTQLKREFKDDVRKNLMVRQVQMNKFGNIQVSHREVEEFFASFKDSLPQTPEQVELRQITMFPKILEDFRVNARKRAEALLDSLKHGADFADLARRYSEDLGSAKNGGRLGLARRGVFVKAFEEAAFALKPGEISGVIETAFGFHIIRLIDRKGESVDAQHILIRVQRTGESDSTTVHQLRELRDRILKGEDFGALAMKYSDDVQTKSKGGDLGVLEVGQLSTEMKQIQQDMKPGEISQPFKLPLDRDYAYAIILLVNRIPAHKPTLETDYQRVASYAKIVKQNKDYVAWLDTIKKNVYWKVYR